LRAQVAGIEHITGHRPPTCPWRAFTTPLVHEVMSVAWAIEDGNLGSAIGVDPPAKLVSALGVFERARKATKVDEDRHLKEEREAKARVKKAMRHG
jgi:hypothetical protein